MKKLIETLWRDYETACDQINKVDTNDPNYEKLLEDRDKIRSKLTELEKVCMETKVKKSQIESENKREKARNIISIVSFIVTTLVGIWTVLKTFKFDEVGTFTGTFSRPSLNNIWNRMFKR